MDTNAYLILSALIYKLSSIGVGALSIYLGYKLFSKGIWGQAGDLLASFKETKLVLRSAAPGTFFAVLGAVILCVTIVVGFSGSNEISMDGSSVTDTNASLEVFEPIEEFITDDKPPLD